MGASVVLFNTLPAVLSSLILDYLSAAIQEKKTINDITLQK